MAGVHGKNAELRISTAEARIGPVQMTLHTDATLAAQQVFEAPDKNWRYEARDEYDEAIVTYISNGVEKQVDQRRLHHTEGAAWIPPEDHAGLVAASVSGTYTALTMETVANLTTDDRSFELNTESDIVDTTTLNESFKTFVESIQGWTGSLDGLYRNPARFKLAIANASGIIPRKILRLKPRPDHDTYFQGTVIFPNFNLSGGYDSAIERGIEFNGNGPLDLVEDGLPWFPGMV